MTMAEVIAKDGTRVLEECISCAMQWAAHVSSPPSSEILRGIFGMCSQVRFPGQVCLLIDRCLHFDLNRVVCKEVRGA